MPDTERNPQLVVINLMSIPDLTNSTRFRLWQPIHSGKLIESFSAKILL